MSNLTDKECLQDELILAAIIAGGMASGRKVLPSLPGRRRGQVGHRNYFGVTYNDDPSGPCCAIGAGVLFFDLDQQHSATQSFVSHYRVSDDYAFGVSAGFEGQDLFDGSSTDRIRGYSVGAAAYDFFCSSDE